MELEVLSGAIKDWEGSNIGQLGDIVFMNLVHMGKTTDLQTKSNVSLFHSWGSN